MTTFIPPNGFQGAGQQTIAAQMSLSTKKRAKKKRKKRASTAAAKSRPRTRSATTAAARRPAKKTGRLKKGSPAAKRRMAQLRKMQKR